MPDPFGNMKGTVMFFSSGGTEYMITSLFVMLVAIHVQCLHPFIHWIVKSGDILIL